MRIRLFAIAMLFAILSLAGSALLMPGTTHAARPAPTGVSVPVNEGSAVGTFSITSFKVVNGTLTAIGTYSGTTANGTSVTNSAATAPVNTQQSTGSCTILDLTIGPINLNLLGLVVTTNAIHVNITAQQGPGNLLGNLLCAVANLLNGGLNLGGLAGLLNQILAALSGL
jgi:hypothetical protein